MLRNLSWGGDGGGGGGGGDGGVGGVGAGPKEHMTMPGARPWQSVGPGAQNQHRNRGWAGCECGKAGV